MSLPTLQLPRPQSISKAPTTGCASWFTKDFDVNVFFGISQNFLQVNWVGCLLFWKSWILSIAISGRISMRRLLTTFRTIYPFNNQNNQTLPQYSCKTDFPNDSRLLPWKSYFSGMKSMAFSFRRVWRFETPHHRLSPGCLSRSGINSVGAQEFSSTTLQPRYSHVLTHGFPRKFKNSGAKRIRSSWTSLANLRSCFFVSWEQSHPSNVSKKTINYLERSPAELWNSSS